MRGKLGPDPEVAAAGASPAARERRRDQALGGRGGELARYAEGVDEAGEPIEVVDRLRDTLMQLAQRQRDDPDAFIANRDVFGDLANDKRFVTAYRSALTSLHERGARATLESLVSG